MQSLEGRVALVTGANSGIGRATAEALAAAGATTIVSGRDSAKVADAVARIRDRAPAAEVEPLLVDLASLASIRKASEEVLTRWPRLDVLVNNAGLYLSDRRTTTDGFEMTFGVNHLGHFYLTSLLLDRLRASAPARVVTVSSMGHRFTRGLDFDDLQNERHYTVNEAYCRSKLANVLFTRELARREPQLVATCLHPGVVRTGFGKNDGLLYRASLTLIAPFLRSPERGARSLVWLALSDEAARLTGEYVVDEKVRAPSAAARDEHLAAELWRRSEELTATR